MHRVLSIYIFFIYLFPFVLLVNESYLFEFLQILLIFSAFYVGGMLVNKSKFQPIDYSISFSARPSTLKLLFGLYLVSNHQFVGDTFMHLFVHQDYASWVYDNVVKRYAGELDNGFLKKVSTIIFFIYAILLGSYGFKNKWKLLYVLFFILIVIESSALARAGVLMAIAAFFVEILIRYNYFFSKLKTNRLVMIGLAILVVLGVVFIFSAYYRIQNESDITSILLVKLGEYILAPYEALYIWMQDVESYANTYGFSTFAALYKIFTQAQVQDGFYNEVVTSHGSTVIYTNIRGFLADIGYFFTVITFLICGFFVKYFTYKKMNFVQYFFLRMLILLLFFAVYSPFIFATFFVAFMLSYLIVIIPSLRIK